MKEKSVEGFRLSPQQKRLWLSLPNAVASVSQFAILISGPLDPGVLKRAVQDVADRHEILRTTFDCPAGIKLPFQVVADRIFPSWEHHDWTEMPSARLNGELDRFFQLQAGPPANDAGQTALRFSLISLAADKHIMAGCLCTLCSDSVTLDNLGREITPFVRSRARTRKPH